MSYTLLLITVPLPANQEEAWSKIEKLQEHYFGDDREKAEVLEVLHGQLTAQYPCLSSYADNDPSIDDCPWADGPMINNFAHDMGTLAITFEAAEYVVPFVIEKALELGIAVADPQKWEIIRPRKPVLSIIK